VIRDDGEPSKVINFSRKFDIHVQNLVGTSLNTSNIKSYMYFLVLNVVLRKKTAAERLICIF
jgi:hypothetical protein